MTDDENKYPPIDWDKLTAPLDPHDIEWLPKGAVRFDGKVRVIQVVPYIKMQALRRRLDEVMPGQWSYDIEAIRFESKIQADQKEPFCVVGTIRIDGKQYLSRSSIGNGANYKEAETDAFKRAGQRLGIGNELYGEIGNMWTPVDDKGQPIDAKAQYKKELDTGDDLPVAQPVAPKVSGPLRDQIPQVVAKPGREEIAPAKVYPPMEPPCPKCDQAMWDNRESKTKPTQPDFKCRDKACGGVWWKAKDYLASVGATDDGGSMMPARSIKEILDHEDDELGF